MQIGVTGHQERPGIDWLWVAQTVHAELARADRVTKALSSLAAGSDQVFATAALSLGIPVLAVLPLEGYERYFHGEGLANYRQLLDKCESIQLTWKGAPERAFFEAGKYVVRHCDTMFAIWDGAPAEGLGGTADIVHYAAKCGRRIIHINPLARRVNRGLAAVVRP
jgi:hypothetical protein